MSEQRVILKQGKEKALRNRHHWIFSGAVQKLPDFENGALLPVYSHDQNLLGTGYFNRRASILGRMICFDQRPALEAIRDSIQQAILMRKHLLSDVSSTNACRLVNAEGDCLPGLIVDRYNDVLVLQISTLGMEKMRPHILSFLKEQLQPAAIYEKSNLPSRKEEGLADYQTLHSGENVNISNIRIVENGLKFQVSIQEGQKTGFFLDQRNMREWVKENAEGLKVLNCFSYSGGFSVYAAAGGAHKVDSIDISDKAIQLAKVNMEINGFRGEANFHAEDVFSFLRENPLDYNMVILDPPAFAKKQKDIQQACRGYKDINRIAMQKMPPNSILVTSSCSYHVNEELFQKVVFQASVEAGRTVKIIGRHRQAVDHPINLCHPEGDYLKSLILYVH